MQQFARLHIYMTTVFYRMKQLLYTSHQSLHRLGEGWGYYTFKAWEAKGLA